MTKDVRPDRPSRRQGIGGWAPAVTIRSLRSLARVAALSVISALVATGAVGPFVRNIAQAQGGGTPQISSFSPAEVSYLGETPFEIRGQNFTPNTIVTLQSASNVNFPLQVAFVDPTRLTGTVPSDAQAIAGNNPSASITVSNPLGGSSTLANAFTYIGPLQVLSIDPSSLPPGQPSPVTITGVGFTPLTTFQIGNGELGAASFVDARTIQGTAPALPAGTYDVTAHDTLRLPGAIIPVSYVAHNILPYIAPPPGVLYLGSFILNVISYETWTWDQALGAYTGATGTATTVFLCDGTTSGPITVRFVNLTIQPFLPGTGKVTAGTASYPTPPPSPATLVLSAAGFKFRFESLTLDPASASAHVVLVFPFTVVDPATCSPVEIDLGDLPVDATNACSYYAALPKAAFGPWRVGATGLVVRGTGLTLDFSASVSVPPRPPSFQGVVFGSGASDGVPSDSIVSNTGYLQAGYTFTGGEVTATGLSASLTLGGPFGYGALQPLDYKILLSAGGLTLAGSAVSGGMFTAGSIGLPSSAVLAPSVPLPLPVVAQISSLSVGLDLSLAGEADLLGDISWGDYIHSGLKAYAVLRPTGATFFKAYAYFSATYLPDYWPLDPGGNFLEPDVTPPTLAKVQSLGIQGLTTRFEIPGLGSPSAQIWTPDIQDPSAPLTGNVSGSWLNVQARGIHGVIRLVSGSDVELKNLGPTSSPLYAVDPAQSPNQPFDVVFPGVPGAQFPYVTLQFVDSAAYGSQAKGTVNLGGDIAANLPFEDLQFTSTAQIVGARIDLSKPIPMATTGLLLVTKPGVTKGAGVLSVKSGEIFLTAAGIAEPRHFDQPFWLTWGEIFPAGHWGKLIFDFNTAGQMFDGFPFATSAVKIGHDFLQAGGTLSFDFFGPDYMDIVDTYDTTKSLPPFNSRVISLSAGTSADFLPTQTHIDRNWNGAFGDCAFDIGYDDVDQDGFKGSGTIGLNLVLKQTVAATIDLNRKAICMSVSDDVKHDIDIVIADFGGMSRIRGCGCIQDGRLQQVDLTAELETAGGATLAFRTATYASLELVVRPSMTSVDAHGDLSLNAFAGIASDLEVIGHTRVLTDFAADSLDLELEGEVDASAALGMASLTGSGKLNWHLSPTAQWIQGRLQLQVLGLGLGLGAGAGVEGGFFAGYNAPVASLWVINEEDPRFRLNLGGATSLTGVYGYMELSGSASIFILSGGFDAFAGLGTFLGALPGSIVDTGLPLPNFVAHVGLHIWGKVLGGLISADAWGSLQFEVPGLFFDGTIGVEGCVAWVACASAEVGIQLDSSGISFH